MRAGRCPRIIAGVLAMIFLAGTLSLWQSANAQTRKKTAPKQESFTRPKPTKPAKPTIPSADRYQEDKVHRNHW